MEKAKQRIRRAVSTGLAGLTPGDQAGAGQRVAERVLSLAELRRPQRVLAYAATPRELPTATLIDALLAAGHAVAVPVVTGDRSMRARCVGAGGIRGFASGPLGVPEPPPASRDDPDAWMATPTLALVPGVAFDPRSGARLGRGGGFYDAWLAEHPGVVAVGLCFDEQRVEGIPEGPHDRRVEALVTPSGTLRF